MIIAVQNIPTFAAAMGSEMSPEPIAVPEIRNTELKNLVMMILSKND